jgi:hypothetical protein
LSLTPPLSIDLDALNHALDVIIAACENAAAGRATEIPRGADS